MNKALKWVRENLAIPLGMVALAAIATTGYMTTEIDAQKYGMLSEMYKQGTDRFRSNLESAASKSSISNWSYPRLVRDYWKDAGSLSLPINNTGQADENSARTKLMDLVKTRIRKIAVGPALQQGQNATNTQGMR
jgi:hypothetical protein